MARSDRPFARHMLDAGERITRYLDGVKREEFDDDPILQDAVIRQLEILGESAGRISREVSARHEEIPWAEITGIRHKLIHDYFVVDLDIVWHTATEDVPGLRPAGEALIEDLT